MSDDPVDPMTALREAAVQFHELYLEFVKAGFSQQQAIELLKAQIIGMSGGKA